MSEAGPVGQMSGGGMVEPGLEIKMVLDNLALAMAVWAGTKKGLITRAHVPTGRAVVTSDDGNLLEMTNPLELNSEQDLIRGVGNQVRGAVAFSAMQTHSTLGRVFKRPPLQESDPDLQAARCVIYLLNHALGQQMLAPVWQCQPAYRRRFEVNSISFVLDATALDGKPVYWQDFGGLERFLQLLEFCVDRVDQPQDAQSGTTPVTEKKLSATPVDHGTVPEFVSQVCVVDEGAQAMAKDLYVAYQEWCADTGLVALGQRSFGMRLTGLGFLRRRRGRGRHWWHGLGLAAASSN